MRLIYSVLLVFLFIKGYAQTYKIDSLKSVLQVEGISKKRVEVLNLLAFELMRAAQADVDQYANEALQIARELNYDHGLAVAYKNLGLIHLVKSEYFMAMEYTYKALKAHEQVGDIAGQSKALNNLAMIMSEQKEYGRAYDFTLQSLRLKRQLGDSAGVYNSYISIAEYFRDKKQYTEAHTYIEYAWKGFESLGNAQGKAYSFLELGDIFSAQKDYPQAAKFYRRAVSGGEISDNNHLLIISEKQLAKLYLITGNLDSAYFLFHQVLKRSRDESYFHISQEIHEHLSTYFIDRNQSDSALYYTREAARLERLIFDNQRKDQIATLQMVFNLQSQDQQIAFQKKIVKRQYVAITGVSLILFLAVLLGIRFSKLNKFNRKAKEELMKINAEKNEININLEALVLERTEQLKLQNDKILEYAFITAHELRGPLARILGLVELAKIKELSADDKLQIMSRLELASNELDEIIRRLNRKLDNAK